MYLSGAWLGVDKSYTKMTCAQKFCATYHTLIWRGLDRVEILVAL
jgi:hypothetical protein